MKRLTTVLLAMVFVLGISTAHAQLYGSAMADRPDWGLEVSILGNYTKFDFTEVNDNITMGAEYFVEQDLYTGAENVEELDQPDFVFDARIAGRYKNLRVGLAYVSVPDREGGYILQGGLGGSEEYRISVHAREYYFFAGYLHPLNDWLEAGGMLQVGVGWAEGTLTDARVGADGVDLDGQYTPWRAEIRARARVSKYVAFDIGGGLRTANLTDMEADYGVEGVHGLDGSSGPVFDYQGENAIDFDFSGWYFGGGITLMNPFEN